MQQLSCKTAAAPEKRGVFLMEFYFFSGWRLGILFFSFPHTQMRAEIFMVV